MRRELGIRRRLDHPNIVPLLGTTHGEDFGSDHPCIVSMWMPHGTLIDYVSQHELSLPNRIRLVSARDSRTDMRFTMMLQITGSAAGIEYRRFKNSLVVGLDDTIPQCIQNTLFMGISTLWVASLD